MKRRTFVGSSRARHRIAAPHRHERRRPPEQALRRNHRQQPWPRRTTRHRTAGRRHRRRGAQPPERGQRHPAFTTQPLRLRSRLPLLCTVGPHRRPALRHRQGAHAESQALAEMSGDQAIKFRTWSHAGTMYLHMGRPADASVASASDRTGGRPALPGVSTTPSSPHEMSRTSRSWSIRQPATEKSMRSTSLGGTRTSGRASRHRPRRSSP